METKQVSRNICFYYIFTTLKEALFWGPILILYIGRVSGMSLADIYFMESVCVLGLVVLQTPFGVLADKLGRRQTILFGLMFQVLEGYLFARADSPLMIWLANLMWVMGCALISGADTALLYDTLKLAGRETEFKKIEGRANSYRLIIMGVCSLATGYLAEINLRLPVYLGAIFMALNCLLSFGFIEPPVLSKKPWQNLIASTALFVFTHSKIKWIIGFSALIGVVSKIWFFTYNPYLELMGVPLKFYGFLFFLLNLVAAISSYSADWLSKKIGDFSSIIMLTLVIALPIMIMGTWVASGAIFLILFQNIARGYMSPFLGYLLNHYVESENRATVISIKSAILFLGEFLGLGAFGYLLGLFQFEVCLQILGAAALIGGLILVGFYVKIFKTD